MRARRTIEGMAETSPMRGGCLCGAVRFQAQGPSKFCVHCHCRWCRRAHGAAFVTWVGFFDRAFEVTAGEDRLAWYASSRESERGFCSRCGTTMLFRSEVAPGEIHVAAACLEGELDRPPGGHVFADQRAPWCELPEDGLPRMETDSDDLAAYRDVGRD